MRVIAGTARRIQLETVKGNNTRPTTDRIKETLFNIINNDLYDIDFVHIILYDKKTFDSITTRQEKDICFYTNCFH